MLNLDFCETLNALVVAEGCYQFQEYHRALMYLEQHMASSNKGLSEALEGGLLAVSINIRLKIVRLLTISSFLCICRKYMHNWMNQMAYLAY